DCRAGPAQLPPPFEARMLAKTDALALLVPLLGLKMPPPWADGAVTLFCAMVTNAIVSWPKLAMPPPSPAWLPIAVLDAIVTLPSWLVASPKMPRPPPLAVPPVVLTWLLLIVELFTISPPPLL